MNTRHARRTPAVRPALAPKARHARRKDRARLWLAAAAAAGVAALTALVTAPPPASATASAPPSVPPRSVTGDSAPLHTALPPVSPSAGSSRASGARGATLNGGAAVVVGGSGIPAIVQAAYLDAQHSISASDPGCHLSWTVLAGIGQVESGQADNGNVTADGTTRTPILGPALDGTGGNAAIPAPGGGWTRAEGPMQFLPTTWAAWGADGNRDGVADPNNVFDAALAAGHYLCAGGRNLATSAGLDSAVLSYNHSPSYLATVTAWITYYQHTQSTGPTGTPTTAGSAAPTTGQPTPATSPGQPTATPTPTGTPAPPSRSASPTSAPSQPAIPSSNPSPSGSTPTATPCPSPTSTSTTNTPTSTGSPTDSGTPTPQTPGNSASPTNCSTSTPTSRSSSPAAASPTTSPSPGAGTTSAPVPA